MAGQALAITLVAAGAWLFAAAPRNAKADNGCPKALINLGQQPASVAFLDVTAQPNREYYAFVADSGQPQALSQAPGGYATPLPKGWLYWVAAPNALKLLAAYRLEFGEKRQTVRGVTLNQGLLSVQEPVDQAEPMRPSHLNGLPAEAQVCALRFQPTE
jgi:hypothetical protein